MKYLVCNQERAYATVGNRNASVGCVGVVVGIWLCRRRLQEGLCWVLESRTVDATVCSDAEWL
jgi:hypothetical protein